MSLSLPQHRVRLTCDATVHTGLACRLQGTAPKIWRGVDTFIEVGLYFDETFVDVVSDISSINLDIIAIADRDGTPLLQKASAVSTITEAEWLANTAAKYHGRFDLTAADTQFDMTAAVDNVLPLWMVIHVLTTASKKITYGAGYLYVEEDGAQNGAIAPSAPSPAYRINDGELQLWNPDQSLWHTVYIKGAAGAEYLAIGPGE